MWKRLLVIILGLLLVLYGGRQLVLLLAGEKTTAVIDKAEVKSVKSRTVEGPEAGRKAAVYYVRMEVDYHFDIYPPAQTRSEAMVSGLKNMPAAQAELAQKQMAELYQKWNEAYTRGGLKAGEPYLVEMRKLEDHIIAYRRPVLRGVKGFDVITVPSRSPQSPYRPGDRLQILFLRLYPSLNAVYLPKRLLVYGTISTAAGLIAVVAGVIWMRRLARSAKQ